jgi:hypothetical protein
MNRTGGEEMKKGIPGAHSGMERTIGELTFTELSKTAYVDVKC